MSVKIIKPNNILLGIPNITNVVYPFGMKTVIRARESQLNANNLPDLCGYLTLGNKDILNGKVVCTQTVLQGTLFVRLEITVYDNNLKYEKYSSMQNRNTSNSTVPIIFDIQNVVYENISKNNLVQLLIYAYNDIATTENTFDLGYLELNG